tara:strand:- start:1243 stop:2049 length:807 start_codon:yes stop_codon:yes gene_type:complete
MPWHASLMPLAPNYLAVERSVLECAYAGCNTIWIVCADDVTPLIRHKVGEKIQDPVYDYRHFEFNKKDSKRPIRIYYVPVNIRDVNKRDNLAWSAIHGAKTANKILRKLSIHLAPDKFWISWPYGYYTPSIIRDTRKELATGHFMMSYKGQTVKDNLYLGLTLDMTQIDNLIKESVSRSTGLWKDPETRQQKYAVDERYSYKNFNLQQVFETLVCSNYKRLEVQNYDSLDSWSNYCNFLSNNPSIQKPKILKSVEWNEIGLDEEKQNV